MHSTDNNKKDYNIIQEIETLIPYPFPQILSGARNTQYKEKWKSRERVEELTAISCFTEFGKNKHYPEVVEMNCWRKLRFFFGSEPWKVKADRTQQVSPQYEKTKKERETRKLSEKAWSRNMKKFINDLVNMRG